jgi:tripartite-type tricarboxylate transporter receptor subunit TctC
LESGEITVVLQTVSEPIPELPKVPLAINAAKTDQARQLIQTGVHDVSDLTYSYVLPPGTPGDRVQMLRKAFADTMKDREFIADANKSNLSVDPMTGEELRGTVVRLFKLDSRLVEKLKDVLKR